jgi:hypothetical protein
VPRALLATDIPEIQSNYFQDWQNSISETHIEIGYPETIKRLAAWLDS